MTDQRAGDAEVAEALAFTRAHKCRCCGTWKSNCTCWGGFFKNADGSTTMKGCTPKDHGRDGYGFD